MVKEPWYSQGLCFECTRCGNCCSGPEEGRVWVGEEEIQRIAEHLGLPVADFGRHHLRKVGRSYSLVEKANKDCIFWDRNDGCTIYEVRPVQCRTFPFWKENVRSKRAWRGIATYCPGIARGTHHSRERIQQQVEETESAG